MAFHNVPPNGFPDIPDIEDLEVLQGEVDQLKSGLTNYQTQNDINLEVPNRKNVFPITLALLKDRNTDGTWSGNDYTVSGVTFACAFNSDGYLTSITANGTSTAYIYFRFYQRTINPLHLSGNFVVSGGLNDNAIFVVGRTYNGAWQVLGASKGGDSNPFTVALSDDIGANIEADNGTEFTNAMFYPMIRPAIITDSTFTPYIPSVNSRLSNVGTKVVSLTGVTTDTIGRAILTNVYDRLYKVIVTYSGTIVFGFIRPTTNGNTVVMCVDNNLQPLTEKEVNIDLYYLV